MTYRRGQVHYKLQWVCYIVSKRHELWSTLPCLVTLWPLCKIFLAARRADPEFMVSDTGQILKLFFWLRSVHFGVVW